MDIQKTNIEPLLNPANNRLTIFPIKYHKVWEHYKKQMAAFWTAEEIDFSKDDKDFEKLNENEQYFIKMVLGFFAASDTIVNINLGERFLNEIQSLEVKVLYGFQMMMENIHSEVYSLMIDNIIKDPNEKNKLFNAIENYDCIKKKASWAIKWINDESPFVYRMIAFAIVEGIFFSGSFCSIFWLKKRNMMNGLCESNEFISRDEAMHTETAQILLEYINEKPNVEKVNSMFKEAVLIEKEFITESLPCSLIGMNSDMMSQYIEFVGDRLLNQLGFKKIWGTKNPFDFMESISLQGKKNFFEKRPTQYQNSHILNNGKDNIFDVDEDF